MNLDFKPLQKTTSRLLSGYGKVPNAARLLLVVFLVGSLGSYLLLTSHAASNVVATEPENGTIAAPATQVTDATASAGKAVKFGAASTGGGTGAISWGWQLTSSNTGLTGVGVNRTTLPTCNGAISSGQTISNCQITHPVDVSNISNVTFDHVWFHPSSGGDAVVIGNGTIIRDSDITGDGLSNDQTVCGLRGYSPNNFTIQRVYMDKVQVAAWIDANNTSGTITDSYFRSTYSANGGHVDGFTRRSGVGNLTLLRDRIEANVSGSTTGAFFLQALTSSDTIGGITLQDSMLEGIGFLITLDPRSASISFGANNVRLNLTTPNFYGDVTVGPGTNTLTATQWSKVYDYNAAAPMDADGGAKGAVVNHP